METRGSAVLVPKVDMETLGVIREPEGLHNDDENTATAAMNHNWTVEIEHMKPSEDVASVSCGSGASTRGPRS